MEHNWHPLLVLAIMIIPLSRSFKWSLKAVLVAVVTWLITLQRFAHPRMWMCSSVIDVFHPQETGYAELANISFGALFFVGAIHFFQNISAPCKHRVEWRELLRSADFLTGAAFTWLTFVFWLAESPWETQVSLLASIILAIASWVRSSLSPATASDAKNGVAFVTPGSLRTHLNAEIGHRHERA